MKRNEPYFVNIGNIGNLTIDFIIFEYECPILFVCKNKEKEYFLCVCYDLRGAQKWILAPVDQATLISLLTDKITIREAFGAYKGNEKNRYLVEWKAEYGKDVYVCQTIKFGDIPDEILPVAGEYIEAEEDEFSEIIANLFVANECLNVETGMNSWCALSNDTFSFYTNIANQMLVVQEASGHYQMSSSKIVEEKPINTFFLVPNKICATSINAFESDEHMIFPMSSKLQYNIKKEDSSYVYAVRT